MRIAEWQQKNLAALSPYQNVNPPKNDQIMSAILAQFKRKLDGGQLLDDPDLNSGQAVNVHNINTTLIKNNFQYICATIYASSYFCDHPPNKNQQFPPIVQNLLNVISDLKKLIKDKFDEGRLKDIELSKTKVSISKKKQVADYQNNAKIITALGELEVNENNLENEIGIIDMDLKSLNETLDTTQKEATKSKDIIVNTDLGLRNSLIHENSIWYEFEIAKFDAATNSWILFLEANYISQLFQSFKTKFNLNDDFT